MDRYPESTLTYLMRKRDNALVEVGVCAPFDFSCYQTICHTADACTTKPLDGRSEKPHPTHLGEDPLVKFCRSENLACLCVTTGCLLTFSPLGMKDSRQEILLRIQSAKQFLDTKLDSGRPDSTFVRCPWTVTGLVRLRSIPARTLTELQFLPPSAVFQGSEGPPNCI